jgi:hypothetical protein
MLSNLETPGTKLLQIILVGQPELQHKLQSPRLRQLRQRIGLTYEISPLSYAETRAYIQHRCVVAGGGGRPLFTPPAVNAVHAYAAGIPRLINMVCDRALLIGYGEEQPRITRRIVRQAVRDLESRSRRSVLAPSARRAAAILVSLLLLGLCLYIGRGISKDSLAFLQVPAFLQRRPQKATTQTEQRVSGPGESLAVHPDPLEPFAWLKQDGEQMLETGVPSQGNIKDADIPEKQIADEETQKKAIIQTKVSEPSKETFEAKNIQFPIRKTVKKGDYVSKYAMEIYGFSNNALFTWLQKHNPHIKDMNSIEVGDVLVFPALDTSPFISPPIQNGLGNEQNPHSLTKGTP